MSLAFEAAGRNYKRALTDIRESLVFLDSHARFADSLEFTPATLAKLSAAMTKIQMSARKISEAAIDAEVECGIAQGEIEA